MKVAILLKKVGWFILILTLLEFGVSCYLIFTDQEIFGTNHQHFFAALFEFILVLVELAAIFALRLISKKRIISPLDRISEILPKAAGGDLSQRLPMKSDDEFGQIASVFNSLLEKQQDLTSSLEKKVKEKTRELETKVIEVEHNREKVEEEKKKIEKLLSENEKFHLAVEGASDQIIITDHEGVVLYSNPATEKITGYPATEMLNKKAGTLWGKQMEKGYYEKMWQILKDEHRVFKGVLKNKRKNGEIYDAAVSISPILNNKNEAEFFVGLERDISEEVAVDRAKTEFVSVASHQLRTPLTAVSWYAEILLSEKSGKLTKKQKEYLKEISDGNKRMTTLVNNLLNVSRLELGTFPVYVEDVDICEAVKDVVKELKPAAQKKKIAVKLSCTVKKVVIKADVSLCRFVFQNLIANAIKYTPAKGEIKIKIKTDAENVWLSVLDNGIGIPLSDQKNIFKKFFRAKNAEIKQTDGTGLGLYIVKSVLDFVGGKVSFSSKEKEGSEFRVGLPLAGMKQKLK